MLLHELRSARPSLTECAEYLNNEDVPPPYCYDCEICDAVDYTERCGLSDGMQSFFRRCQKWTESNWLDLVGALGRDIRERQRSSETHEFLASLAASMGYGDVTDAATEFEDLFEVDTSEVETWDNEVVAAQVLAALLDGEYQLQDTQVGSESSGMHDYDIRLCDGRVIALEITQQVNSQRKAQQEYIESELTSLCSHRHNWSVRAKGEARLEMLRDRLPEILSKLEELGIHSLYTGASHSIPPFMVWLRSLAVRSITCIQMTTGPGCIHVHADSESGHTSHELVTGIADAGLRRKAEKLRRAQADERHLWIWVDLEAFSMSSALSAAKFTRPSTRPDMTPGGVGEEIDVVWVAGSWIDWSDGSPNTPIFKCDGASWEQVALPMDAQQIIADAVERSRPN